MVKLTMNEAQTYQKNILILKIPGKLNICIANGVTLLEGILRIFYQFRTVHSDLEAMVKIYSYYFGQCFDLSSQIEMFVPYC